jgi:hypothetical protein
LKVGFDPVVEGSIEIGCALCAPLNPCPYVVQVGRKVD